jgi:hypothetical protein
MSVKSKEEVSQTEAPGAAPVKRGKRQTCMRHCKRFWWIYLIVFLAIVVLVVCLVIFVGVPKIAQSAVNDAELEIQGVHVLDTTEDTYLMEINSTITTDGHLGATVKPFEGQMYLTDLEPKTPFAVVSFPQTSGDANQKVNVSQEMRITDMEAFTTFNTWFFVNETLRVTVEGDTDVRPDGLDRNYGVDFKKTVTIKGLNLFNGTEITDGKINLEQGADYNFVGTAEIPNQSVFTLDIGNATFRNFAEGQDVGSLEIENLLLVPGTNTVEVRGNLNQSIILGLATSDKFSATGIIPFQLLGETVMNNGHSLSYFAESLGSSNTTVNVNVGAIIRNSLGGGSS